MDVIYVVHPFKSERVGVQIASVIRYAQTKRKPTVALAYPGAFDGNDDAFLRTLGHPRGFDRSLTRVRPTAGEFKDFFTLYGQSQVGFYKADLSNAVTLGEITDGDGGMAPAAFVAEDEDLCAVYTVPFHIAKREQFGPMLQTLFQAVEAHRAGRAGSIPEYLVGLRLGQQENAVLEEIDRTREALTGLAVRAAEFARWRHLIGRASGESFATLVVDALNVVLGRGPYRAEQREEVGAEDFWVVGAEDDVALGEAKGIGGGIARAHVSQVDSHREIRKLSPDFSGLLVVNSYKNDVDLARKQGETVAPNVVSLAASQNVVVLRAWDLYQLVGVAIDGGDASTDLMAAMEGPTGGWFQVDDGTGRLLVS